MNEDGTMARMPQLREIAKKFDLKIISIASLIAYRLREESLIEKGVTVPLPTEWGDFKITPFRQKSNGVEHVALTKGEWTEDEPVLIRVHSSCATGDIFGSYRCDYGVGAGIIRELGIRRMRLLTNNPLKRAGLEGYGLKIDEIVPIVIAPNKYNEHYLETKQERMQHTLGLKKK